MEKRMKAIEIEISYLRKAIEELKKMRTVEIHTHYTTQHLTCPGNEE